MQLGDRTDKQMKKKKHTEKQWQAKKNASEVKRDEKGIQKREGIFKKHSE